MSQSNYPWYFTYWFIALLIIPGVITIVGPIIGAVLLVIRIVKDRKHYEKETSNLKVELERIRKETGYEDLEMMKERIKAAKEEHKDTQAKVSRLEEESKEITSVIKRLDDEYDEQEIGFFVAKYHLPSSEVYKERIKDIREQQKALVKGKEAVIHAGTEYPKKVISMVEKLALRSFNKECDLEMSKVTGGNAKAVEARLKKSREQINKICEPAGVSIHPKFLNSKLEELFLQVEYAQKIEEEKEEQREIRERMREEEKVGREIEKIKQKIQKEQDHFEQAKKAYEDQLATATGETREAILAKIQETNILLEKTKAEKEDVELREKNARAGYVYIISNIGSLGEEVYKIGMTRRLEPMDRISELSNASVPFNFDVHAMIFSEDAPGLEAKLHETFKDQRVNKVNLRKEHFKVTLGDIEKEIRDNHNDTITFTKTADAIEYRQTLVLNEKVEEKVS
ncbi:DUF4041 domain-containing protein [Alteribacter aurantiacus]|uniref:DUF4041 domain-containing protein n=1 Tax=Alteribacter aurantiacus TaxID=254410 RepID=UPI0003F4D550|nr:DUF4041 domain-containing protein [Alteribacter aurantiacus]